MLSLGLPQAEEFKYMGILLTSDGRLEREIERRIWASAAPVHRHEEGLWE